MAIPSSNCPGSHLPWRGMREITGLMMVMMMMVMLWWHCYTMCICPWKVSSFYPPGAHFNITHLTFPLCRALGTCNFWKQLVSLFSFSEFLPNSIWKRLMQGRVGNRQFARYERHNFHLERLHEKFAQRTCIAFVSSTLSSEMFPRFLWHFLF